MNQQSGTTGTRRKSSLAGNLAAVVATVAIALGTVGIARADDVHGGIVAAERYRAPQPSTQDVRLGDQSLVQLLQNDAFLKVAGDGDIQQLVAEPGFLAASRLLRDHPETARQILSGRVAAQSDEAARVLSRHATAARLLLAHPDATRVMLRNAETVERFASAQRRVSTDRRAVADRLVDRRSNRWVAAAVTDRSSVDGESTEDRHKKE